MDRDTDAPNYAPAGLPLVGVWVDISSPRHPGAVMLVDRDDYLSRVRFTKWTLDGTGYAVAKIGGKKVSLHRILTGAQKGEIVDHIDGDKLNNLRTNLRIVTSRQNRWNSPGRPGTSRYTGVCWDRSKGVWKAQINARGVFRHLGYFTSEEDAARAYNAAAEAAYGDYARLNEVA